MAEIQMHGVSSSNVDAIGYDLESKVLRVRFSGGGTYDYQGVPKEIYLAFDSASSKGSFVYRILRRSYPAVEV